MENLSQIISSNPNFTPLFHFLDDIERYGGRHHHRHPHTRLRPFRPTFDIRDLPDAYELEGEVPGVKKQDLVVEFDDSQALVIRGHVERFASSGAVPASHDGGVSVSNGEDQSAKTAENTTGHVTAKPATKQEDPKTWVTERSVGDFRRTFMFPEKINPNNVSATLADGILHVRVAKAEKDIARSTRVNVA